MYEEKAGFQTDLHHLAPHTFPKDVVIQANLALELEAGRARRLADAAREAEELKVAAEVAKRKHACLLMCKADAESRLWNERWKTEELAVKVRSIDSLFLLPNSPKFETIEIADRLYPQRSRALPVPTESATGSLFHVLPASRHRC